MFSTRKLAAATLALALSAAPASFAMAEETAAPEQQPSADAPQKPETPQATPGQAEIFEEEQLDAFASAVIKVSEIQDSYTQQLENAEDETAQKELIAKAEAEMRVSIEETEGLTFEDYLDINHAAAMDQDLNLKIAQRLQALQANKAG
ncbi:DUF4168 domain-containing protein [Sulfitobacter aestuarii]|uniref:DUF4168 domain-containing protein n=1 Tax=Sulfitobacter aestuarii TaxID=2161676 RepID=A0ABW5U2F2_9RHOB